MPIIAKDSNNTPRLLYIDSSGRLVLGPSTQAIGKLSANDGVDIGDVDVASLPSLPTGTNTIGNVITVASADSEFDSWNASGAGSDSTTFSGPASGYVRNITQAAVVNNTNNYTWKIGPDVGLLGTMAPLYAQRTSVTAGDWDGVSVSIWLTSDDDLFVNIAGCSDGDSLGATISYVDYKV